jgi:hypothetical protein
MKNDKKVNKAAISTMELCLPIDENTIEIIDDNVKKE